jgi:hypothetical protein
VHQGIGGESRGDKGEIEGDFTDNFIAYFNKIVDFLPLQLTVKEIKEVWSFFFGISRG